MSIDSFIAWTLFKKSGGKGNLRSGKSLRQKALLCIAVNDAHSVNADLSGSLNLMPPKRGWIDIAEFKMRGIQMCPRICIVVLFQATNRRTNPCLRATVRP